MRSGTHFRETDLLELYADTCGKDAPVHPHLAQCPGCAARYAALANALQDHGEQVSAEADRLFTAEGLARQCNRILHRLHDVGHFARVIPFPARGATDGLTILGRGSMTRLVSRRWVAAAAAAGLMLGFFAERVIREPRSPGLPGPRVVRQVPAGVSPAVEVPTTLVSYEDAILDEIDAVIARRPIPALVALDDLTPRMQSLPLDLR
ncbi:MAG: hypothetical protein HYZ58_06455 [Acidobacteria bacterium]|nr:hypothetical protein [Acidobacteriota bacterium]